MNVDRAVIVSDSVVSHLMYFPSSTLALARLSCILSNALVRQWLSRRIRGNRQSSLRFFEV